MVRNLIISAGDGFAVGLLVYCFHRLSGFNKRLNTIFKGVIVILISLAIVGFLRGFLGLYVSYEAEKVSWLIRSALLAMAFFASFSSTFFLLMRSFPPYQLPLAKKNKRIIRVK